MDSDMIKGLNKAIDAATGETGGDYTYLKHTEVTDKLDELADAIAGSGGGGGGSSTLAGLTDVAISNPTNGQVVKYNATTQKWVNSNEDTQSPWTEVTSTLTAGNTSLTISNASFLTTSTIDIYTDVSGANPTTAVVTNGQIVLTFEEQSVDVNVKVRIS